MLSLLLSLIAHNAAVSVFSRRAGARGCGTSRSHCTRAFACAQGCVAPALARMAQRAMDALTPCRFTVPSGSPCFLCDAFPSFRLQPPHGSCARFYTLPFSGAHFRAVPRAVWASSLASRLALPCSRIEFVILRTNGLTPVAPHPALRRRSYRCLRAGERMPDADYHRADFAPLQAH